MNTMHKFLILLIFLFSTACSTQVAPVTKGAVVGGVGGAATGAIVGEIISNGDVANSALLGAGVGTAVGIVGTYAVQEYREHKEIEGNNEIIKENYEEITDNQGKIEVYREDLLKDTRQVQPTAESPRHF